MRTYIRAKYGPPKVGETRTIEKFAWCPKKIIIYKGEFDNKDLVNYYWIWLEKYKEDQKYVSNMIDAITYNYKWEAYKIYQ